MPGKKKRFSNGYTTLNKVKLIRGGREYFSLLLELIQGARQTIHLQVYVFDDDETGYQVADALKQAVKKSSGLPDGRWVCFAVYFSFLYSGPYRRGCTFSFL